MTQLQQDAWRTIAKAAVYEGRESVMAQLVRGHRQLVWVNASNRPMVGRVVRWGEWGIEVQTTLRSIPFKTITWHCPILGFND